MNPHGPYLMVAGFCEAVLEEQDNRMSCIRFLDRIEATLRIPADAPLNTEDIAIMLPLKGLLAFKSGSFKGKKTVRLDMEGPDGKSVQLPETFPALFEGNEHGINLKLDFTFATKDEGLYWFGVYLDQELMARMPLRLLIKRERATQELAPNLRSDSQTAEAGERPQEPHQP